MHFAFAQRYQQQLSKKNINKRRFNKTERFTKEYILYWMISTSVALILFFSYDAVQMKLSLTLSMNDFSKSKRSYTFCDKVMRLRPDIQICLEQAVCN